MNSEKNESIYICKTLYSRYLLIYTSNNQIFLLDKCSNLMSYFFPLCLYLYTSNYYEVSESEAEKLRNSEKTKGLIKKVKTPIFSGSIGLLAVLLFRPLMPYLELPISSIMALISLISGTIILIIFRIYSSKKSRRELSLKIDIESTRTKKIKFQVQVERYKTTMLLLTFMSWFIFLIGFLGFKEYHHLLFLLFYVFGIYLMLFSINGIVLPEKTQLYIS